MTAVRVDYRLRWYDSNGRPTSTFGIEELFKKKQPIDFKLKHSEEISTSFEGSVTAPSPPSEIEYVVDSLVVDKTIVDRPVAEEPTRQRLSPKDRLVLLMRRLAALVIDQLICFSIAQLTLLPAGILLIFLQCTLPLAYAQTPSLIFIAVFVVTAMAMGFFQSFYYCSIFESSDWQATPGKRLLGLYVTNVAGKRMLFGEVFERLFKQAAIAGGIAFVAGIVVKFFFPQQAIDMFLVTIIFGTLWSLFNRRGQTFFDQATHRIVAVEKWSPSKPDWVDALKQACKILFYWKGKPAKLMVFSACYVIVVFVSAFPALAIIFAGLHEADKADWNTDDTAKIAADAHFQKAEKMIRNPGTFYFIFNSFRSMCLLPVSLEEYKRASLSYHGWAPHYQYALALEKAGQIKKALYEVQQAILIRENSYGVNKPTSYATSREWLGPSRDDTLSPYDRFADGFKPPTSEEMGAKEAELKKLLDK